MFEELDSHLNPNSFLSASNSSSEECAQSISDLDDVNVFEKDLILDKPRLSDSNTDIINSISNDSDSDFSSITLSKFLSFASSFSINLILPFINGLMLGFGELVAHEFSWRFNLFNKRENKGYKIFPESRKLVLNNINDKHNQNKLPGNFL